MGFGAIIIGDEILSGRRQDKHLAKLIELLGERGLKLSWVRYVTDSRPFLVKTLQETMATGDVVFSFGGIGATPDDHTRQAAAEAVGQPLALHPEAEAILRGKFGDDTTAHRLQMGVYPVGAAIIPNPYNQVPGFSIAKHYFVPGFPVMAWPMVAWVLDTCYAELFHAEDYVEQAVTVWDAYESQLVALMERITADYPDVTVFSLPAFADGERRRSIELGVKGTAERVAAAMAEILAELAARSFSWDDKA
ncbi:competence/damage-inducible protein A [Denitromonas ohlonensis]|uniref:Competence/damage-inducible protein A n=2 Tax=Denitromonas TaxID=139331 RepID=A0A557SNJ5_9RHOO|nr:molybdopterin-binding protein [Denitromonas ohlonensis]TVO62715.1 competence/damage-inducible protein A [Denitromonas ohlonensis]TVO78920.1 competence/damage-inducible protein A [Denitromonas ohlonensis]